MRDQVILLGHGSALGVLLLVALEILGCASPGYFLVLRDVPPNPAFVVLPFNATPREMAYADRVEQALLASRVTTRSRPSIKLIATESEVQAAGASDSIIPSVVTGLAGSQKLSESYVEWGGVDADYIVRTHAATGRIKIENASTQEILTVFEERGEPERTLNIALSELGLAKRQVKLAPPQQGWIPIQAPAPPPDPTARSHPAGAKQ